MDRGFPGRRCGLGGFIETLLLFGFCGLGGFIETLLLFGHINNKGENHR